MALVGLGLVVVTVMSMADPSSFNQVVAIAILLAVLSVPVAKRGWRLSRPHPSSAILSSPGGR
jgi:hypothetical protein